MNARTIPFQIKGDDRGSLIALESNKNIPFDIKRVYYIFGTTNDTVRGKHAHKTLEQVLVCTSGSCTILLDNGTEKQTINLSNNTFGLYVGTKIWREMSNFSPGCVLMVLASEFHDEAEYIRDYDDFLSFVK
jgi:dTDP-4-dehydrorhamnose 3,5-epimerase-like enzyme